MLRKRAAKIVALAKLKGCYNIAIDADDDRNVFIRPASKMDTPISDSLWKLLRSHWRVVDDS